MTGFSLVELLALIALLVVLLAVLYPSLSSARARGERAACIANQRRLYQAAAQLAQDSFGYLPGSHPGNANGGYCYWECANLDHIGPYDACGANLGADPLDNSIASSNSLVRLGDWDTIWRGDVVPGNAGVIRKGKDGHGGQLATYLDFDQAETKAANAMAASNNWRRIDYQWGLTWSNSYKQVYLPRRVAHCPSVRPYLKPVRAPGNAINISDPFRLDSRGYTMAGAATYSSELNKDFMPSYGINPFITAEGRRDTIPLQFYKQFSLSQIYRPSELFLFADRPHPLMDLMWDCGGERPEGGGMIAALGPYKGVLEDIVGGQPPTGKVGPYAPEARHELLAATYLDGHVETMLWSNFAKSPTTTNNPCGGDGGYITYRPGRAYPGSGGCNDTDQWPATDPTSSYSPFLDAPFVNRVPGT